MTKRARGAQKKVNAKSPAAKPKQAHASKSHVHRHLAGPRPRGMKALRLVVRQGDEELVLGTWEADDVRPALADEILDVMDGHADVTQADVVATMSWTNAAGDSLQERQVRRAHSKEGPAEHPVRLSGTTADQAAQAQRHHEIMARTYTNAIGGVTSQMKEVTREALALLRVSQDRAEAAEKELARLRRRVEQQDGERLNELLLQSENPTPEQQESALSELMKMAQPLMQLAQMAGLNKPPGSTGSAPAA